MKYLKKIEYYRPYIGKYGYKIGDYVLMKRTEKYYGFINSDKIFNMVNTQIGQISGFEGEYLFVKYGEGQRKLELKFNYNDIVLSANTKEELEAILNAKKYNL